MLDTLHITGSWPVLRSYVLEQVDRLTCQRLNDPQASIDVLRPILSTAHFSPPLPVLIAGSALPDGSFLPDTELPRHAEHAAAAGEAVKATFPTLPSGYQIELALEIDCEKLAFVATLVSSKISSNSGPRAEKEDTSRILPPAPIGQAPANVTRWFSALCEIDIPEHDGRLETSQAAVGAFVQHGKSANTRRAYRSAIKGWCAWTNRHGLLPCPHATQMWRPISQILRSVVASRRRSNCIVQHFVTSITSLNFLSRLPRLWSRKQWLVSIDLLARKCRDRSKV